MVRSNSSISTEDKELLSSLPSLDLYKPLIKLLNRLVEDQANAVLSMDLSQVSDRELSLQKARMEGATRLVREFDSVLTRFKKPE